MTNLLSVVKYKVNLIQCLENNKIKNLTVIHFFYNHFNIIEILEFEIFQNF
jgi:hypothetical protein